MPPDTHHPCRDCYHATPCSGTRQHAPRLQQSTGTYQVSTALHSHGRAQAARVVARQRLLRATSAVLRERRKLTGGCQVFRVVRPVLRHSETRHEHTSVQHVVSRCPSACTRFTANATVHSTMKSHDDGTGIATGQRRTGNTAMRERDGSRHAPGRPIRPCPQPTPARVAAAHGAPPCAQARW